jgi:hypothetical protein
METSGTGLGHSAKDELSKREDEATSKETLKDLDQKEKNSGVVDETHEKPLSPDGSFDESHEIKEVDEI